MSTRRQQGLPPTDPPASSEQAASPPANPPASPGPRAVPAIPTLYDGLVDDAAVFPPGSAALPDAVIAHRRHRDSWYAELVGPLLIPASALTALPGLLGDDERIEVGVIADVPLARLAALCGGTDPRIRIRQIEAAVAKRGEDPVPGLRELLAQAEPGLDLHAEIPLTWGVTEALDLLAEARRDGIRATAKFRTGGLAAELYPTPVDLAGLIVACRERAVPFKLTAGLHRAVRHTDPETGFVHHGFLNVLTACLAAAAGEPLPSVTERLAGTDAVLLIEGTRPHRRQERPLWTSFGTCDLANPIADLRAVGLL